MDPADPVTGRLIGPLEDAWRFCRRHPLIAGVLVVLVVAVTAGTVIVTSRWLRAETERDRANSQRLRADVNSRRALLTARTLVDRVSEMLQSPAGRSPRVLAMLLAAETAFEELYREAGDEDSLAEQGELLLRFTDLYRDLGRTGKAADSADRAVKVLERLYARQPDRPDRQARLADAHEKQGVVQVATGRLPQARASHERALALRADRKAETASSLHHLAGIRDAQGDRAGARRDASDAVAILEKLARAEPRREWRTALGLAKLQTGELALRDGDLVAGLSDLNKGYGLLEEALNEDAEVASRIRTGQQLVRVWEQARADTELLADRDVLPQALAEATPHFRKARQTADAFVLVHPDSAWWRRQVVFCRYHFDLIEVRQGKKPGDAQKQQAEGLRDLVRATQALAEQDADDAVLQGELAQLRGELSQSLFRLNRKAEALPECMAAVELLTRLVEHDATNVGWAISLAEHGRTLGDVLASQDREVEALSAYLQSVRRSLQLFRRLNEEYPNDKGWQEARARTANEARRVLRNAGEVDAVGKLLAEQKAWVREVEQELTR